MNLKIDRLFCSIILSHVIVDRIVRANFVSVEKLSPGATINQENPINLELGSAKFSNFSFVNATEYNERIVNDNNIMANSTDYSGQEHRYVNISIVTWNMAESSPEHGDMQFISHLKLESDIICLGVQEVEDLRPRRREGRRCREWRRLQHVSMGRDFVRISHHYMGAIHLTIYAKRSISRRVKLVKESDVACGIGNVMINKGAVAAFLRVDKTTFLFVNAHLAAHQEKVCERNDGYHRIMAELEQKLPNSWVKRYEKKRLKELNLESTLTVGGSLCNVVDRIFFFGDLNYRVELSRLDMLRGMVAAGADFVSSDRERFISSWLRDSSTRASLQSVLDFDQLTVEKSMQRSFVGFNEASIEFPPTYKYDRNSDYFDSSAKMRIPAWTDRILYRPSKPSIQVQNYTSIKEAKHSDHRPVVGTFRVQLNNK